MDNYSQNETPQPFDQNQTRRNRIRCQSALPDHAFICDHVADQVADRLLDIKRNFPNIALIGPARLPQNIIPVIKKNAGANNFVTIDYCKADIIGNEEALPFGRKSLDSILSILTLHTINDLPGALFQINYALKPDGLFLGAMLGGETLYELRHALMAAENEITGGVSPRVMPFADKQDMGALLQRAGFALPVVDSDVIEVTYTALKDLLYDIRGMGESNIVAERPRHFAPRALFDRAEEIYKNNFSDHQGRLIARFEVIYLIGWAPHESQQKPLRPGSAENSLAEAIGGRERKTDIPTG